jgi:mono/diheme cytochrome c family protein
MVDRRVPTIAALASIALLAVACGGEKANQNNTGSNTSSTSGGAMAPAGSSSTAPAAAPAPSTGAAAAGSTSTAPAGGAAGGAAAGGTNPSAITPQMVALGDSIFHGKAAGGLCFTCHGADAKGTPLAPPLVQHQWKTGDGSYGFLLTRIKEGMPNPTPPYTAPMPPMGGANLTQQQIQAVAAYVYSLSHPNVGKKG